MHVYYGDCTTHQQISNEPCFYSKKNGNVKKNILLYK